jgi:hypothetical protein
MRRRVDLVWIPEDGIFQWKKLKVNFQQSSIYDNIGNVLGFETILPTNKNKDTETNNFYTCLICRIQK